MAKQERKDEHQYTKTGGDINCAGRLSRFFFKCDTSRADHISTNFVISLIRQVTFPGNGHVIVVPTIVQRNFTIYNSRLNIFF